MTTTQIFIELLITGVQAAIWILLFFLSFLGTKWIDLAQVKELDIFILLIAMSIAYPLGIMLDNLSDRILGPFEERLSKKITGETSFTIMELRIASKNKRLLDYFEYVRRRIRTTRSSIFNFPLITIAIITFTASNSGLMDGSLLRVVVIEFLAGVLLTILAISNWIDLSQKFRSQIMKAHKLMGSRRPTTRKSKASALSR